MMLKKLFLLLLLIFFIIFFSGKIQKEPLKREETITVEIKGCVRKPGIYELELGSDMDDLFQIAELLENADFSSFSLNSKLYNDQLIIVPEIIEEKKISIISADIEELCTLPGSGPKIAQRILDYRIKQGSFLSLEEIKNVSGIGNVKFKRIKELITL